MAAWTRNSAIPAFNVSQEQQPFWQSLIPYGSQWAAAAATWPLSWGTYEMWGTDPAALPWVSVSMSLAGAGLSALTWKATTGPQLQRVHATATAVTASAWMTAATIVSPFGGMVDAWMIGGAVVALSWNIRRLLGRGKGKEGSAEAEFFKSVKLAGAKMRGELDVAPNKVTAQLQLPPGQMTADDVTSARGRLASALSVSSNAVRVSPDPDHHDRATVTVVPVDMLKQPSVWAGPSAFGGSISAPLVLGGYEDGEALRLYLPGDKSEARNATHVLVMGMNGSGKTHGAKIAWTEILTRRDVNLWVADPAKGKQSVGPILGALQNPNSGNWAALGPEQGQAMIDCLPDVIRARANYLGEHGYDQWVEGCGLPYLVVWIEEAAPLVRDSEEMIDIAQQARSAGVSLVLSLQRPSYRNITTDVRQQLGTVWCFGVKSIQDAAFALAEELIEGGANPAAWGNKKPGYNYLEAPGVDDDRMLMTARTSNATDQQIIEAVTAAAEFAAPECPVTRRAAGQAYADRHAQQTPATGAEAPKPHVRGASNPLNGTINDHDDQNPPPMPENHEDDLDGVDLDQELPPVTPEGDALQFAGAKPTLEEARTATTWFLTQHQASGAQTVGPKDFPKDFFEHIRSRPWLSAELGRMADQGLLIETSTAGVYRYPATPQANAA
nr:hypothetical protein [Streptomyces sp. 44030]